MIPGISEEKNFANSIRRKSIDLPRLVLGLPHERTYCVANTVRRKHDRIDSNLLCVTSSSAREPR